ncbi:MAG: hypothetical protein V1745_02975 [Patescibacteria group bacterium]
MTTTNQGVAFWEEHYPGKGKVIMELVGDFYGRKYSLKPALPDLEQRVRAAIFWREVNDVHISTDGNALVSSFRQTIDADYYVSIPEPLRSSLWKPIWRFLHNAIRDSLIKPFFDLGELTVWIAIFQQLQFTLFYAIGNLINDRRDEATRFKRLLDLWLMCNVPIGLDKEGNLLVLVAPAP